ncbi:MULTISPECIES: phasin family protein [Pseudomonas]|jgi:poly(hydroxyalkanoate) granule-associated protein|uniref:Poly granule-associated protein n=6 Tax=Pseudomonas TaxID=286 RepID=Q88D20_PSEPK|nr:MULTISPECIES: phasin family protein [Pseudomonas]AAN70574.1 Poly granule-associated protein [Pseudomonas putida KT2440]ANC83930.1 poly(3-hydroxyalkanoate) granule-associated protein PhaI [Pseudomonas putida B6-2]ANI05773.1 poly(3-hydroxyalkanoate) granule-associated protein PhaI [Pseudomonas putida SJTE-1]KMU95356.1 poly(3-hydroxyalkanoate) granule-associated protein PhaI [Pseudomonas putida]KMY27721.1 poly(3-hydroxyalkanoate) granule-associated protein PhaI [Pseudomonas putida]
MAKVIAKKKDEALDTLGEVRGYARKIWLAGIGAYARVGQEGADYFKELVRAGEGVEKRGKKRIDKELDAANHQLDEVGEEVSRVRGKVEIQLDKIEKAFDARVGRALNRLGIPSKHDVEALSIKLEQLHELLERVAHKP